MKACHLTFDHVGKTLMTRAKRGRRRGTLLDLTVHRSYVVARVRYPGSGETDVVLANHDDIEIEE
ncbi:hypothetical protein IU485_27710 [Nocardia cyriacigeorgica]|uniref:hypothetical protein n=1 Tax=Nocardia cyriacigeorgica TaxID=135487 RepID=UPI001894F730|nr:hypothetical protein [Nocardia cyriacigeorgica]MBF6085164.1 hypothetical protein [Nocardia cyriacigeorgica]